jgi:hypothetical protein
MWIGTGATLGGTVIAALAVVLCFLDPGAGAADYIPVVAVIAGTLGVLGGGIAGTTCALLTALLDRWTGGLTALGYAAVAAAVTAGVAGAFGSWLMQPGSEFSTQVWGWVVMPVAVSTAVAAVTGALLWHHAAECPDL